MQFVSFRRGASHESLVTSHLDSRGFRSTFRRRVVRRAFAFKSESPKVSKLCQHGLKGPCYEDI